jgi:hypothetical protein
MRSDDDERDPEGYCRFGADDLDAPPGDRLRAPA